MLRPGDTAPRLSTEHLDGRPLCWPSEGARSALLLVFTRPVESPHGRAALLGLSRAEAALKQRDADLAVVVPSASGPLRRWLDVHAPGLPVVADPRGALAEAWGMGRDPWLLYTLRGLQQGEEPWIPALRALRLGGGPRALRVPWLPAELLLDARGRVLYARLSCARCSQPDPEAALSLLDGRPW